MAMPNLPHDHRWHQLTAEILTGMREWRAQHPQATLRAMEDALDRRWAAVRARMLQDMALQSAARQWKEAATGAHPTCPDCGTPLEDRGGHPRDLPTHGGQTIALERSDGVCPTCQVGLFPPRCGTGRAAGQSDPAHAGESGALTHPSPRVCQSHRRIGGVHRGNGRTRYDAADHRSRRCGSGGRPDGRGRADHARVAAGPRRAGEARVPWRWRLHSAAAR